MTLTIPAKPITGESLRAAWGEVMDDDLATAAARCGYVEKRHQRTSTADYRSS